MDEGVRARADALVAPVMEQPGRVGLVVGLLAGDRQLLLGYGVTDRESKQVIDGETLFEIGSITKVMTAALLADMARRGEVRLDQPLKELLPSDVPAPRYGDQEIHLAHLATHTSSLPRLPSNLDSTITNEADPYVNYHESDLYDYLRKARLRRPIGSKVEYSNLGMGLLGHVLAKRLGTHLEQAFRERLWAPLGMGSSSFSVSEHELGRLAKGHDTKGQRVANWHFDALAGAGAVRSTAADVLRYLRANLGEAPDGLSESLRAAQEPQKDLGREDAVRLLALPVGLLVANLALQALRVLEPGTWQYGVAYLLPLAVSFGRGWRVMVPVAALLLVGSWLVWRDSFGVSAAALLSLVLCVLSGTNRPVGSQDLPLGWQASRLGRKPARFLWHNGGTGGYCSYCGFVPESRTAVVVLCNSSHSVDELGLKLLTMLHDELGVWNQVPRSVTVVEGETRASVPSSEVDRCSSVEG